MNVPLQKEIRKLGTQTVKEGLMQLNTVLGNISSSVFSISSLQYKERSRLDIMC